MTVSAMKVSRWMLGAAAGIACLFIGDNAPMRDDASLVARANARAASAQAARNVAGVARRTHRRAAVHGTIPLDLGYSAGGATSYGYAPGGSYGGLGCYRTTYGMLTCPP
jgi:hypothetical protein